MDLYKKKLLKWLIKELKNSKGSNRIHDAYIGMFLEERETSKAFTEYFAYYVHGKKDTKDGPEEVKWLVTPPNYTEEVIEASKIIPSDFTPKSWGPPKQRMFCWEVGTNFQDQAWAQIFRSRGDIKYSFAYASSPPIALCLAALQLRKDLDEEGYFDNKEE